MKRTARALLGSLVLLGASASAVACRTDPGRSSLDDRSRASAERIARLEAQLAQAEASAPRWSTWLSAARRLTSFRCNTALDCTNDDESSVYDRSELERLSDRTLLQKEPKGPGPLQALVDLSNQLRAHGIDLLVVFVPSKTSVYPELVADVPRPTQPGDVPRPDVDLRRFYLALERSGVEVLDIYDAFYAKRYRHVRDDEGRDVVEKVFREQDVHWSSYGASLAADLIAERVKRYPWFAACSERMGQAQIVETVAWQTEHGHLAPIAAFLGLDAMAVHAVPQERFALHQIFVRGETVTAKPLYDAASPIALIGDSNANQYSRDGSRAGLPDHLLRNLGFRLDVIAMGHGSPYTARAMLGLTRHGLPGKRLLIHEMHAVAPHYADEWKLVDLFGPTRELPGPDDTHDPSGTNVGRHKW
jgi:predicted ester cyclase